MAKLVHLCYQKLGSNTKPPFEVQLVKELSPTRCIVAKNGERYTVNRAVLSTKPVDKA